MDSEISRHHSMMPRKVGRSHSTKSTPQMLVSPPYYPSDHLTPPRSSLTSIESYTVSHIEDTMPWSVPRSSRSNKKQKSSQDLLHWFAEFCPRNDDGASERNSYYIFRPIWLAMSIFGIIPITLKPPYIPCAVPWRSTMLYSLAMYVLVMYKSMWRIFQDRLPKIDPHDPSNTMDQRMYSLLLIVHIFPLFYVPILWLDSRHVETKFGSINSYMKDHERVTGEPLYLSGVRRVVITTVVFTSILFPLTAFALQFLPNQTVVLPEYLPAYVFAGFVEIMCSSSRVVICSILKCLARSQVKYFERVCLSEQTVRPEDLRQCRRLWTQLREVYCEACCSYFIELLLAVNAFLMITLGVYLMLVFIFAYAFNHVAIQVAIVFIYSGQLLAVCINSQLAMEEMRDPFVRILDQLAMSSDKEIQEEVKLFFAIMSIKPATLQLAKFVEVDRALFVKVISSIITYIVVLIQFRSSDDVNLSVTTGIPT